MAILSHGQLETLWESVGGAGFVADTAAAVAQAESGGNTTRINNTAYPKRAGYHKPARGALPEYSVGLWQINMLAHPSYTEAELLTEKGNATAARQISNGGTDWMQWTTFKNGTYAQFLVKVPAPPPGTTGVPGGPVGAVAPSSLHGYHSLQLALAGALPTALKRSAAIRRAAMRKLA